MTYHNALRKESSRLGALSPTDLKNPQLVQRELTRLERQVKDGLRDLVATTEHETDKIERAYRNSWTYWARWAQDMLLTGEAFKGDGKNPIENWADNINSLAEQTAAILSRPNEKGVPFYMRKPQDAERLLIQMRSDLTRMIDELDAIVDQSTFRGTITTIIDAVIAAIVQLVQILTTALGRAFAKFPLGGAAIVLTLAGVYFWKRKAA